MTAQEADLTAAVIRFDGSVRGPSETGIKTYRVEVAGPPFWFEAEFKYGPNGDDFRVTIRNYGLRDKTAAGSLSSTIRRQFSASQAQIAKKRVEAFFLKAPVKGRTQPSGYPEDNGHCLGVVFPEGW